MPDATSQRMPTANVDEISAIAAEWIMRRDRADWGTEDEIALNAWQAKSSSNLIAFLRLEDIWERANRLQALNQPPSGPLATIRQWAIRPSVRWIAGIILLTGLAATAGGPYFSASNETAFATLPGERKTLTLADGSQIDLNTASSVRVSQTATKRMVRLESGEAFFRIKHDARRPFVVLAGYHRITDIGTEFLVRTQPYRLEVSLIEGQAKFDAPDGRMQSPILMTPGVALVVADNLITTTKKGQRELGNELAWRRGMIVFDRAPLAQIAAEFNRYGGTPIVITDESVGKIPLSATLPTTGARGFVELAKGMLGLKVTERRNEIDISR